MLFFFQAEDGIRDYKVTGVQTCALPIWLMDGFDVGAIYSFYVAAFVLFQALMAQGAIAKKIATGLGRVALVADRKSTRLNSSHLVISYAVFCLKKKNTPTANTIRALRPR